MQLFDNCVHLSAGSIAMPVGTGVASCPPATLVAVGKNLQMQVSSPLADLQTPPFAAHQRYSSIRCSHGILLWPTADWPTHGYTFHSTIPILVGEHWCCILSCRPASESLLPNHTKLVSDVCGTKHMLGMS